VTGQDEGALSSKPGGMKGTFTRTYRLKVPFMRLGTAGRP
jgi:hypothetical protein